MPTETDVLNALDELGDVHKQFEALARAGSLGSSKDIIDDLELRMRRALAVLHADRRAKARN